MEPINIIGGTISVVALAILLVYAQLTSDKDCRSERRKEKDARKEAKKKKKE